MAGFRKRSVYLMAGFLCLFLASCHASGQSGSDQEENENQGIETEKETGEEATEAATGELLPVGMLSGKRPQEGTLSDRQAEPWDAEKLAYMKAYTEFLLDENIEQGHDFPIRGYYLLDLNFDEIPELGILHDSWGSMGGYFTFYCFDGKEVTAVLDDRGEPVRISNYTQILADFEQRKVYFLKEMYLLVGNSNGTYGYVREVKSEGGVPCVYAILNLVVDQESDTDYLLEISMGKDYIDEDDFLSDPELEDCLITQCYAKGEWVDISLGEYLRQKREWIPEENSFVDLRDLDMNYLGVSYDEDGFYTDVRIEQEEINQLFRRYVESH